MLQEVLDTISNCKRIDKIIIVSKDDEVLKLGRSYGAVEIFDDESGVNNAINLADQYISDKKFDCSIIFPQDVPIMKSIDIDNLLSFVKSERSCGREKTPKTLGNCVSVRPGLAMGVITLQAGARGEKITLN